MPRTIPRLPRSLALLLPLALCTACMTGAQAREGGGGIESNGRGVVLSGVALDDGPGSVLHTLQGKIPGMKVQRYRDECPHIALRSDATFRTLVNPHVYVDGTRATDTCILETLQSQDMDRVEIYPGGVSGRPGYPAHPHGLILLFMRS